MPCPRPLRELAMPIDPDFAAPTDTTNRGPAPHHLVVRMLWFAMIGSVFIFTGVGLTLPGLGAAAGEPAGPNWVMIGALGAVSALILGLVAFAESWLAPRTKDYLSYCLVRWAMCESVAIYGLVLHFIGAVMWLLPTFSVLALLGMLLAGPSERDVERWEQSRAQ